MESRALEIEPICTLPHSMDENSQNGIDAGAGIHASHSFGNPDMMGNGHNNSSSLNVQDSGQNGESRLNRFGELVESPPFSMIPGLAHGSQTLGDLQGMNPNQEMIPKRKNSEEYFGFLEVDSYKFGFGGAEWGIAKDFEEKSMNGKSQVKTRKDFALTILEKLLQPIDKHIKTVEVLILKNNLLMSSVRNKIKTAFEDLHIIEKEMKYMAEKSPHNSQIDIKESLKEFINDTQVQLKKTEDVETDQTVQDLLQLYTQGSSKAGDPSSLPPVSKLYDSDLYESREELNAQDKHNPEEEIKIVINSQPPERKDNQHSIKTIRQMDREERELLHSSDQIVRDLSSEYKPNKHDAHIDSALGTRSRLVSMKLHNTMEKISANKQEETRRWVREREEVAAIREHMKNLCAAFTVTAESEASPSKATPSSVEEVFGLRTVRPQANAPPVRKTRKQKTPTRSRSPSRKFGNTRGSSPTGLSLLNTSTHRTPERQPLFTRDTSQSRISLASAVSGRSMKKLVEDLTSTLKSRPFEGRKMHSYRKRTQQQTTPTVDQD